MGIRQERLADEIRDIIANLFSGGQLSDPRISGVCITAVKLSGDLQIANVYYRNILDSKTPDEIIRGLESVTGFLRHQLSEHIDVRRIPALRFFYDESIDRANRIETLLTSIKE